jgi:hypothetical protein
METAAAAKVTLHSRTCRWGLGNWPFWLQEPPASPHRHGSAEVKELEEAKVSAAADRRQLVEPKKMKRGGEMCEERTNPSRASSPPVLLREPISYRHRLGARKWPPYPRSNGDSQAELRGPMGTFGIPCLVGPRDWFCNRGRAAAVARGREIAIERLRLLAACRNGGFACRCGRILRGRAPWWRHCGVRASGVWSGFLPEAKHRWMATQFSTEISIL